MKLTKTNFLLLITIVKTLLIKTALTIEWEPEALANITQPNDIIIDTNSYLDRSSPSYPNIINYIQEIQSIRNFTVLIYYIDAINPRYTTSNIFETLKDIEKFTNDLAWFVLKQNIEAEQNSLIILFSMTDRQSRIRTGKNVRSYLSDGYAEDYLYKLRGKMRAAKFTEALEDLMKNLHWRITGNTFFYDLFEYLFYVFAVLLVVYVIYYFCCRSNTETNHEEYLLAENTLEKIKRISEKNKDNPRFLEDNCIVCLEEFTELEKNELRNNFDKSKKVDEKVMNVQNDVDKQNFVGDNTLIPKANYEKQEEKMTDTEIDEKNCNSSIHDQDENAKLISDNQNANSNNAYKPPSDIILTKDPKNHHPNSETKKNEKEENKKFIAILDCGHVFHSECIASWSQSHNTCPICRKNIDGEGNQNQTSIFNLVYNIDNLNLNQNCQVGASNHSSHFGINRRNHTSLIEDLLWVQTHRFPRLTHYHFSTDNGLSWVPPVSNANSTQGWSAAGNVLISLFGRGSGGGSGRW